MLERRSAIAGGLAAGGRLHDDAAGVRLGELRGWSLMQVAGFRGGMAPVEQALAEACGVAASIYMGEARRGDGVLLLRTGPEQIWLVGETSDPARQARIGVAVTAAGGTVLELSHSRTRMVIEGPRARDVLAKDIAIDLDAGMFAPDRFALTGYDHTPVLLHRTGDARYELWAMRTFAQTVWERLADAAAEFGYDVG